MAEFCIILSFVGYGMLWDLEAVLEIGYPQMVLLSHSG